MKNTSAYFCNFVLIALFIILIATVHLYFSYTSANFTNFVSSKESENVQVSKMKTILLAAKKMKAQLKKIADENGDFDKEDAIFAIEEALREFQEETNDTNPKIVKSSHNNQKTFSNLDVT